MSGTVRRGQRAIDRRRVEVFDQVLALLTPGRLVDLGAGHGAFAVRAADLGWQVTGVDARSERWPDDPRVEWVQSDVRDAALEGYDLIACLGLFYHLTLDDQLALLQRAAPTPLLLETHVADGDHVHELSELVEVAGYEGRRYREPWGPTSSWGNEWSFWPTLASLRQMVLDAGYSTVLTADPWVMGDRTYFLCLAPPAHS